MKGDAQAVFNYWLAVIRSDKSRLYVYSERRKHLHCLMHYLKENEIDMDEASFLKNKVVDVLVHEEGKKNKGKYKDWVKNAKDDFDDCLQLAYVQGLAQPESSLDYKQDPDIVAWAHEKFGNNIPARALKDCHSIGNVLYFSYIEDLRRKQTC